MLMKKVLKGLLVLVLVALIGSGSYVYYMTTTPEFALTMAIADVRKNGMDGLKKHLTEDTRQQVEWAMDQVDNSFLSGLLSSVIDKEQIAELKTKMAEIDWEVKDVLKGKQSAEAQMGFNYKDQVKGTINIEMSKPDGKWKISGIEMPSFDKLFF